MASKMGVMTRKVIEVNIREAKKLAAPPPKPYVRPKSHGHMPRGLVIRQGYYAEILLAKAAIARGGW